MTDEPRPRRRILIGAASFADAESALRLAERIAGPLASDLGGLMIEDSGLAELLAPPGRRIVTASGQVTAAPSVPELERLLAAQARAFRSGLERLAAASALRWSFERRAGELVSGLCAAAKGWDLLVVGQRQLHRLRGPVVALLPPADGTSPAAVLAETVAAALHTGVVTFEAPPESPEGEAALLDQLSRRHAAVVVADLAAGPLHGEAQLRRLIEAARCPVLLLGADRLEPAAG